MNIKQIKKELNLDNADIAEIFGMTARSFQTSTAKKRYEEALCLFYAKIPKPECGDVLAVVRTISDRIDEVIAEKEKSGSDDMQYFVGQVWGLREAKEILTKTINNDEK